MGRLTVIEKSVTETYHIEQWGQTACMTQNIVHNKLTIADT